MKKQKVCIIGGGLTAFVTAITLSKLNLEIDLIVNDNFNKSIDSPRTLAISQNNYDFLNRLKIDHLLYKEFWPCSSMKLYSSEKNKRFDRIFEINKEKKEKKVLYMIKYSNLIKKTKQNIYKNKLINLKMGKKYFKVKNSNFLKNIESKKNKYNLIIACGENLVNNKNNLLKDKLVFRSYNEYSITTILKHNLFKNNTARQLFIDDEILALLPVSKNKTSIVWSIKKNKASIYTTKKNFLLKKKIKSYTKDFLKKIEFFSKIEFNDLKFSVKDKYFNDRILFFGDILHKVHPLTGQGFNMVLRDLLSLEKILKNKINLGLDIGSSDILDEFSKKIKPSTLAYSFGIDFLRSCFSVKNESVNKVRNKIIKNLDKNVLVKEAFYNVANDGLKF